MKKYLPYIIGAVLIIALGCLLVSSARNKPKVLDERITLRQKDKIPYGTYVARTALNGMFPKASIGVDVKAPGNWDMISGTASDQAVILMSDYFNADDVEMHELLDFADKGNVVFIVARDMSYEALQYFGGATRENGSFGYFGMEPDSLRVSLEKPPFKESRTFIYPGFSYKNSFQKLDWDHAVILGRDEQYDVNFVQFNKGKGRVFVHLAPMAFSNYFLLHKNNIAYYKNTLGVIPARTKKIVWNEYYLIKPQHKQDNKRPGLLRVLMQYPSFKWALITLALTLLLYVLMEMRRKQRPIPFLPKPKNDSLEFVKTIGQLYYDRKDHRNLAWKMSVYFLEHLRIQYKINTQALNDTFIETVQVKSGYPAEGIKRIVDFIQVIQTTEAISEQQLANFHQQLELFYQKT